MREQRALAQPRHDEEISFQPTVARIAHRIGLVPPGIQTRAVIAPLWPAATAGSAEKTLRNFKSLGYTLEDLLLPTGPILFKPDCLKR